MYKDCEKTIKTLANVLPILFALFFAAIFPIIDCLDPRRYLLGSLAPVILLSILMCAIGAFIGYLLGSFFYGFAEIVENTKKSHKE